MRGHKDIDFSGQAVVNFSADRSSGIDASAAPLRARRFSLTSATLVAIVILGFALAAYTYKAATAAINTSVDEFNLRRECFAFIDSVTRQDSQLYDLLVTHDAGTRDQYYALDAQIRPQLPQLATKLRALNIEGGPVLADDIENVYPLWRDSIARPVASNPTSKESTDTLERGQMYVTTFADDIGRVQREIDDRMDTRSAALRQNVFNALIINVAFAVVLGSMSLAVDARRRRAERASALAAEEQALHDVLTGLPNRKLFADRVRQALLHRTRHNHSAAILYVDLDDFKSVNDRLGHAAGDAVLRQVALRLEDCVRKSDTVSRQGGDEFAILLTLIRDAQEPTTVAQRIVERVSVPMLVRGEAVSVGATVGIALSPQDGEDLDLLIKLSDEAMLEAKRSGKGTWRFVREQEASATPYGAPAP